MLQDKCFIITGASRGIGSATAQRLLEGGARVAGTFATGSGDLSLMQSKFGADRVLSIKADLSQEETAETLFSEVIEWAGSINGIVNNAGIMIDTPPASSMERWHDDWGQTLQVNVQAVADLCKLSLQHFQNENVAGEIVNLASRAAFRGDGPDYMHYAASKGAVVALTRTIARAYAHLDIGAYVIAPGWVKTDMASVAFEPGNEHMLDEIPLGRAADPKEVASLISFLLSGQSKSSTGATFDINGASYIR